MKPFELMVNSIYEARNDFVRRAAVPLAPGEARIPSNHVRLFHYTRVDAPTDEAKNRAAEKLRRSGLDISQARGHTYGEPNQIWSSTKPPHQKKVFAEFSVPFDDPRILYGRGQPNARALQTSGWDVTFGESIKPGEIIAVHEPWHFRYRYLLDNPNLIREALAGELDDLLDEQEYGPAVAKLKMEHGINESVVSDIRKTMKGLTPSVDYGIVWFNTNTGQLQYSLADGDESEIYDEWEAAFKKIKGVKEIEGDAEIGAPKGPGWIKVGVNQGSGFRESFESIVERSYSHAAVSKRLDQRRADPRKQVQGRRASKDHKKAGGQRHGQRQRSARRSRVNEKVKTGRPSGVLTAFLLNDGTVVSGEAPTHYALAKKLGIDFNDVRDGGFIIDGEYRSGSADTPKLIRLAKARRRVAQKRAAVKEESPYGSVPKHRLPKQPPSKLWHVTLFAGSILRDGFKTRNMLRGQSVLGGGSDDSVSFTSNRQYAENYANGLRMAIDSMEPGFDPWDFKAWHTLLKKYGFNPAHMREVWRWKQVPDMQAHGRYDDVEAAFEILQAFSLQTRGQFPLFMGGNWPRSMLRAKKSDVAVLEIDADGPELWSYHPGEKEFRIYDVENIQKPKRVA